MAAATNHAILGLDGRPLRPAPRAQYDGATHSRRTAGWHVRATDANAEIAPSLAILRDRHRDLARNNPWARRAIQAIINNWIGPGLQAQWTDPGTQALWRSWFESVAIDADGRSHGYGLQSLIARTVVESGECLVRRRPRRPEEGLPIPLQIQVLEPDYLDHAKTATLPTGGWITAGVEFNPFGRRVAYWLFPEHPGSTKRRGIASVRYDAADFLHCYRLDRPGQVRGVVWGAGAMLRLRMLDDYADAQLERQRIAACYMAFVRDTDMVGAADVTTDLVEKLEPGAIEILPSGKDMTFASPPQPEDDKEFKLSILQAIAADYGLPYETLTGDLSQVNFSSARMGWNEFSRNIADWRWNLLAPQVLNPLVGWFAEAAALVGVDTAGAVPLWSAPARVMVDESREIPAIRDKIRAGLISLPEAIRQQGYDPETVVRETAAFNVVLD
jgi:lambda family phage portal protein